MTPAQADLLRQLIAADRRYRSRVAAGDPYVSMNDRGIEVSWSPICGVNPRTADVLVDLGLAECLDIGMPSGNGYLFLGKYEPFDPVEE